MYFRTRNRRSDTSGTYILLLSSSKPSSEVVNFSEEADDVSEEADVFSEEADVVSEEEVIVL